VPNEIDTNDAPSAWGKKTRVLESVEYVFARIGVWLVEHTPARIACALAKFIGDLAFFFMPRRRRIAVGNILKAGIADTPRAARRIARASARSIALTVAESFIFPRYKDANSRIEFEISQAARDAIDASKCGFICYSGHFGNWEIGAQALSRFKPVTGIARPMNNERVQALMDRKQMRADFETIDKHSGRPMDMVRALKRNRVLAILSDQHARGDSAVVIDVFGRPAKTYPTPAVLQQLTGAPIFFTYSLRTGFMRFRVHFSAPIFYTISRENKAADIQAATQDLSKRLEEIIRQHPEQYLWAHRRWKYADKLEAGAHTPH
jgi:KDO2-lipid IV(A) lauroyltransferase